MMAKRTGFAFFGLFFGLLIYLGLSQGVMLQDQKMDAMKQRRVLMAFMALGTNERRNNLLHDSLIKLTESDYSHIDCILLVWAPYHKQPPWAQTQTRCQPITLMNIGFVDWLKIINPTMVKHYDFLQIMPDDVDLLTNFDNDRHDIFLQQVKKFH